MTRKTMFLPGGYGNSRTLVEFVLSTRVDEHDDSHHLYVILLFM